MKRRDVIALIGGAATWPLGARAQQAGKLPTIGFLGQNTRSAGSEWTAAFVQRLRELGWTDGRTIAIEYRWGEGREERFAEAAAELVRLKVDVSVVSGTPAVMASKRVTSTIPIVFATAGDPVGNHLVDSLARPGGNVTGLSVQSNELAGKRIELLREVVPGLRRLAILGNVGNPFTVLELAGMLASLIDGRCSWPTVIPAFVASKRSTSLAIKPSALRRELRRGAETRPSLDELYYDSMQAQREARLRLDAPTPRVRILCMPAILMTRLHPTHRGAETVALPLGPLVGLAEGGGGVD